MSGEAKEDNIPDSPLDTVESPAESQPTANKITIGRAGARALLGLPQRPTKGVTPIVTAIPRKVTAQPLDDEDNDRKDVPDDKKTTVVKIEGNDEKLMNPRGSIKGLRVSIVGSMKGTQGKKRIPKADVELGKMFQKMEQTFKDEEKVEGLSAVTGDSAIQSLAVEGPGTMESYSKYRDALQRGIQNAGITSVDVLDTALSKGFASDGDLAHSGNFQSQNSIDDVINIAVSHTQDLELNEKEEEAKSVYEQEKKLHRKLSNMDMLVESNNDEGSDPMRQLKRILHSTSEYREKVIKEGGKPQPNGDLNPSVESHLMYVASAVINDAWSRRWFNLNRFETSWAVKAHNVLLNPYYKMLMKGSILMHMFLAVFEPASTFQKPACGKWANAPALVTVEGFFIAVYVSAIILMHFAFGGNFFSLKKKTDRGRKTYPLITSVVTFIIFIDWILRATIFYSTDSSHPGFAVSRALRPILLLANSRPLRDMFATILRVMPSVSALTLGSFLLILSFSVVGFHLFQGTYPQDTYPENFDSWPTASVLLFALFTTENYPECMSGAMQYSTWFSIYFLVVMVIGQSMLTIMLGLVYDAYRQSVMKTALKNYRKEREALTAAFALVAKCPAKKPCIRFPCRHGEGYIDLMTWTRLFTSFKLHPSNTYVHKVWNRNAGGLHSAQISLIASELFKTAVEKPRSGQNEKLEKALAQKKSADQEHAKNESLKFTRNPEFFAGDKNVDDPSPRNEKDESGNEERTDGVRERKWSGAHERKKNEGGRERKKSEGAALETEEAGTPLKVPSRAKRKSVMLKADPKIAQLRGNSDNQLIQSLPGARAKTDHLDIIAFFGLCDMIRSRLEVTVDKPLLKAKQSWLRVLQALSSHQNLRVVEGWQKRSSLMARELAQLKSNRKLFKKENASEFDLACEAFRIEFDSLSGADKMNLRALMIENIDYLEKVFGEDVDTDPLVDLASAGCLEMFVSSKRWNNFVNFVIILHLFLYLLTGIQSLRNVDSDKVIDVQNRMNLAFVCLYVLENGLKFAVSGKSFFASSWNRYNLVLSIIAVIANILLLIPRTVNLFGKIPLQTLASFVVFRLISVAVSMVESPANLRNKNKTYDRYLVLRYLVLNVVHIGLLMMWVLVVVYYIFAILGMELFGCSGMQYLNYYNDPQNLIHFDHIGAAVLSLFQLTTTSNWMLIMYAAIKSTNLWAVVYFVFFYFLVLIVIVNLFTALVVEALVSLGGNRDSEADKSLGGQNTFDLYTRFLD